MCLDGDTAICLQTEGSFGTENVSKGVLSWALALLLKIQDAYFKYHGFVRSQCKFRWKRADVLSHVWKPIIEA
jgi:hypothetical protein